MTLGTQIKVFTAHWNKHLTTTDSYERGEVIGRVSVMLYPDHCKAKNWYLNRYENLKTYVSSHIQVMEFNVREEIDELQGQAQDLPIACDELTALKKKDREEEKKWVAAAEGQSGKWCIWCIKQFTTASIATHSYKTKEQTDGRPF